MWFPDINFSLDQNSSDGAVDTCAITIYMNSLDRMQLALLPVFVSLVDDPYLVSHSLSREERVNVWYKFHHLIMTVPEGHHDY